MEWMGWEVEAGSYSQLQKSVLAPNHRLRSSCQRASRPAQDRCRALCPCRRTSRQGSQDSLFGSRSGRIEGWARSRSNSSPAIV